MDITDEEGMDKVFAAHPKIDSVIHFGSLKVARKGLEMQDQFANSSDRQSASLERFHSNTTA